MDICEVQYEEGVDVVELLHWEGGNRNSKVGTMVSMGLEG